MGEVQWDIGPDGVNPGGNGISIRTADALKLGILHAQKGVWQGRQVLPRAWVEAATHAHGVPDDGYHWVVGDGYYAALGVFVQMEIGRESWRQRVGQYGKISAAAVSFKK